MSEKGKAHRHRSSASDFFETPYSAVWELMKTPSMSINDDYWEPACGNGAILKAMHKYNADIIGGDISEGFDFLQMSVPDFYRTIITNPPFSLFDEFVLQAQKLSQKFAFIVPINYFGAYKRVQKGVWKHLRNLYIFNRQVDYRGPIYDDGTFHVGGMVSGWRVWDMSWKEDYWTISIMDVQKYATRGQFVDKKASHELPN